MMGMDAVRSKRKKSKRKQKKYDGKTAATVEKLISAPPLENLPLLFSGYSRRRLSEGSLV